MTTPPADRSDHRLPYDSARSDAHDPAPNPRFSTGLISYRTDSPDSSLYLARLPIPSDGKGKGSSSRGHGWSGSMDTRETGRSLPSSLAHHIEEQRAAVEAEGERSAPIPLSPTFGGGRQSRKSLVSTKSFKSFKTYSSISSEPTTLFHAQHARRASASSHNLLSQASLSSLIQAAAAQIGVGVSTPRQSSGARGRDDADRLNRELGQLPWPELPPRSPSTPGATPGAADSASFLLPSPAPAPGGRAYSFLESDPLPSGLPSSTTSGTHSRRSSRSSVGSSSSRPASRARPGLLPSPLPLPLPPKDVPISPALSSWSRSGDGHLLDQQFSAFTLGGWTAEGGLERQMSALSGMADVDSSTADGAARTVSISASAKSGMAPASSGRRSEDKRSSTKSTSASAGGKSKRSKSMRSAKSGKSGRSKRISVGSSHYRVGRWEVEEGVPLVPERNGHWRDVEEKMDLDRLLARSLVLEKMLRHGKRVSAQSFKKNLVRRITASTKRSSLSASQKAPSSFSNPPHQPSNLSQAASKSSHTPSAFQQAQRKSSSSTSSRIRHRLSRKILRRTSQEDVYTPIGSDADRASARTGAITEEDDPSLFPPPGRPTSMLRSARPGITHSGITVFPEHHDPPPEPKGPPTPPKPAALHRKLRPSDIHPFLVPSCIPHHSSSTYDYSFHEKSQSHSILVPHPSIALRDSYDGPYAHAADLEKGQYRQSPHLGHRSPGWRDRRASLASYISTGHWDGRTQKKWIWGVVIGGGLLLILIIGLVSGLLGQRS